MIHAKLFQNGTKCMYALEVVSSPLPGYVSRGGNAPMILLQREFPHMIESGLGLLICKMGVTDPSKGKGGGGEGSGGPMGGAASRTY